MKRREDIDYSLFVALDLECWVPIRPSFNFRHSSRALFNRPVNSCPAEEFSKTKRRTALNERGDDSAEFDWLSWVKLNVSRIDGANGGPTIVFDLTNDELLKGFYGEKNQQNHQQRTAEDYLPMYYWLSLLLHHHRRRRLRLRTMQTDEDSVEELN